MRSIAIVAAVATVAGACAAGSGAGSGSPRPELDSVTVEVVNNNFYDANVYADYQGLNRRRLGMVVGHTSATFRIPWHHSDLTMVMTLVGAGTSASNSLVVHPGDVLRLELLPDLHLRATGSRGR